MSVDKIGLSLGVNFIEETLLLRFRPSVSSAKIEFRRSAVKFGFLTRQSRGMAHCAVADADWTELRRRLIWLDFLRIGTLYRIPPKFSVKAISWSKAA
jgi:hypothetical protein